MENANVDVVGVIKGRGECEGKRDSLWLLLEVDAGSAKM